MHRACLVSQLLGGQSPKFALTLSLTLVFMIGAHAATAAPISSRLLIDPVGGDGDTFGVSIASAGDVNGDGLDDLIVGANYYPSLSGHGQAYLFFGGPGIDSVPDLVLPSPLATSAWFGISVASAGDFNGDGYADLIVGARYAGAPGQAFIYYGGPSLDATPDLTLTGEATGFSTWFGTSVAPLGDVNGDGFDDVIVGSPMYRNGTGSVGRAYVFYGGNAPNAVPDRVFTGVAAGDQLGYVVGSAGDMNGDGSPDAFATAPYNDAGGTDAGAVYVWFGGPAFDTIADLTIVGTGSNERLTYAASAGNLNADGFSDLIVSGLNHAEVFFGGSSPNAAADLILTRNFVSVAGAGDVNGDGVDDFMLGVSSDDTGGTDAGRVSVFYGGSTVDLIEDLYWVGNSPGRRLGRVVAAGRLDGPGPADLFAGASEDLEFTGYDGGRVYVFANSFVTTAVPGTPSPGVTLMDPWPNPARSDVNLDLTLDHGVPVSITVYDIAGHVVARPISDEWLTGYVSRTWRPEALPSGIYYIRAKIGQRELARKVTVLGRGH
jgi:FG-GAP repeat protein/type IX secretion system substrate protein